MPNHTQTYREPRDGYVSKLRFYLADVGAAGDIVLCFSGTLDSSEPWLGETFFKKVIPYADLRRGWNDVTFEPVFVQKGTLYSTNYISSGNHTFLLTVGGNYSEGTLWTYQDGAWTKGDQGADIAMQVFHCKFTNLQTITTMEPLTLEGGIGAVRFRDFEILPEGTTRVRQLRINGLWTDVTADTEDYVLGNLNAMYEMRQIMTGTADLQPAMNHDISRVITYRLRTDFKGPTRLINVGSAVTSAKVTVLLHGFNEGDHDCAIKLLRPDNTVINHATVDDTPTNDPNVIERTATFTFAAMSSFRIRVDGEAVSSLAATFGGSEIIYQAAA